MENHVLVPVMLKQKIENKNISKQKSVNLPIQHPKMRDSREGLKYQPFPSILIHGSRQCTCVLEVWMIDDINIRIVRMSI